MLLTSNMIAYALNVANNKVSVLLNRRENINLSMPFDAFVHVNRQSTIDGLSIAISV